MPAPRTTSKAKKFWLHVYGMAVEANVSGAKQDVILEWVRDHRGMWNHTFATPPADSTAKAYLAELAKKTHEWLDLPWSIGASVAEAGRTEIPREALPDVMAVWRRAAIGGQRLTVRQAIWTARLSPFFASMPAESDLRARQLYGFAKLYALRQRIGESNEDFDTSGLDALLAFGAHEMTEDVDRATGQNASYWLALHQGIAPDLYEEAWVRPLLDDSSLLEWMDAPVQSYCWSFLNQVGQNDFDPPKQVSKLPRWRREALLLGMAALCQGEEWKSRNTRRRTTAVKELWERSESEDWHALRRWLGVFAPGEKESSDAE